MANRWNTVHGNDIGNYFKLVQISLFVQAEAATALLDISTNEQMTPEINIQDTAPPLHPEVFQFSGNFGVLLLGYMMILQENIH